MYRSGEEYDAIEKIAVDIYIDYGFNTFPLDEKQVCRQLGLALIPYSEYEPEDRDLLKKRSIYGFLVPGHGQYRAKIFYNDSLEELQSRGCIRQTILHEVKHYVCEDTDENPEDDDLADYFAKYMACPIPYLIINGMVDPDEIVARFGVSRTMARYISQQVVNRKRRYGDKVFEHERPLIKQLDPVYYDIYLKGGDAYESKNKTY